MEYLVLLLKIVAVICAVIAFVLTFSISYLIAEHKDGEPVILGLSFRQYGLIILGLLFYNFYKEIPGLKKEIWFLRITLSILIICLMLIGFYF